VTGRRVTSIAALSEPGDYVPTFTEDGAIKALWFILPEGTYGRIAAEGHEKGDEPGWKITLDENGVVTVDPSINYPDHWHGFLRQGVWS
jgi:hypothetical protein